MSCSSRDYTSSDGFMGLYYYSKGIENGICDINNEFKGIVGGKSKNKKQKKRTKRRITKRRRTKRKTRKYRQYTNAKKY